MQTYTFRLSEPMCGHQNSISQQPVKKPIFTVRLENGPGHQKQPGKMSAVDHSTLNVLQLVTVNNHFLGISEDNREMFSVKFLLGLPTD